MLPLEEIWEGSAYAGFLTDRPVCVLMAAATLLLQYAMLFGLLVVVHDRYLEECRAEGHCEEGEELWGVHKGLQHQGILESNFESSLDPQQQTFLNIVNVCIAIYTADDITMAISAMCQRRFVAPLLVLLLVVFVNGFNMAAALWTFQVGRSYEEATVKMLTYFVILEFDHKLGAAYRAVSLWCCAGPAAVEEAEDPQEREMSYSRIDS